MITHQKSDYIILSHAAYLRKIIEQFIIDDENNFQKLQLSDEE